jgi:CO/xanthine dehydrogenase Mo-binding subunit
VLCNGEIRYAGQPLGVIVAKTQSLATSAALKVNVKYSNLRKPYISIREVIASGDKSRIKEVKKPSPVKIHGKFTENWRGSWRLLLTFKVTSNLQVSFISLIKKESPC